MRLEEQRRQETEKASRALGEIVSLLREGTEPVHIARRIAAQYEVDETKAFRWVEVVAESFERSRRRIALPASVLVWAGALVAATGALLALLGVAVPSIVPGLLSGPAVLVVLGGVVLAGGLLIGLRARRLASVNEEDIGS